jgi:hypothetical protein
MAGMCARSVMAMKAHTVFSCGASFSTSGAKVGIEEQHLVFRVVDDVVDLLGKEPRVHRVQHRARARHAEVQRQVAPGVPCQRAHAVAGLDVERHQRVGHLLGAALNVGVVGAVHRAFHRAPHDLGVRVKGGRMVDERRDQQRAVLHQSEHGLSPVFFSRRNALHRRQRAPPAASSERTSWGRRIAPKHTGAPCDA